MKKVGILFELASGHHYWTPWKECFTGFFWKAVWRYRREVVFLAIQIPS